MKMARSSVPPTNNGRKRKRGQAPSTSHAASPAPSDPGSTNGNGTGTDTLLSAKGDFFLRPRLSISRGPTFVPVEEGSEWYRTENIGVNRTFRYVPAGINPQGSITLCRTIESNPTSFRVSWEDRSPFLRVTKDGLSLAGFRGFRSARCNAPVREGKWYMEVKIINGGGDRLPGNPDSSKAKEGNHVRIGWGRRESTLNGPVGLDGYSYGYRDKTGEKVTLSRPRPYGKPFKSGDVVGMYISLPPLRKPSKKDPDDPAHFRRERIPIDLKGQEVFEILEYPVSKEMTALMDYSGKPKDCASVPSASSKKAASAGAKPPDRTATAPANAKPNAPPLRPLPILAGSKIAFFVNGECQGTAFEDVYDFLPLRQTEEQKRKAKERSRRVREGVKAHIENAFDDGTLGYYPMISLFNDAIIRINPGPDFDFPPPLDIDAVLEGRPQPTSEASQSEATEETSPEMEVDTPVKSEPAPENVSLDAKMEVDSETKPKRTWRPIIERYPEFMQEQWDLDTLEEQEAQQKEAQKQMAAKSAGAPTTGKKGANGKGGEKKGSAARSSAGGKKKKATDASAAETPEPGVSADAAPAKKKAKKNAGQAALGIASGPSVQPTPSDATRSATETPMGTPPPPSVHHHLQHHPPNTYQYHHALAQSESASNRPSPSPLRQSSTAYRDSHTEKEGNELPLHLSGVRQKKPPGSQKGRDHAQQAAAAAAAASAFTIPHSSNRGPKAVPYPVHSEQSSTSRPPSSHQHRSALGKAGTHSSTSAMHRRPISPAALLGPGLDDEDDDGGHPYPETTPAGYESSNAPGTPANDTDFDMGGDENEDAQSDDLEAEFLDAVRSASTPGDPDEEDDDEDFNVGRSRHHDSRNVDEATTDGDDEQGEYGQVGNGEETDEGDRETGIGIEIEAQTASRTGTSRSPSPG
ncbi:Set1 complex component ash2 [Coprinopsis cinerea okayama7|uniref:Set1 complex component ash2 n=1 Tax=Coprinopsis cinerea (strain Okayama-7 / 130 / ATCC MYA-4618 / FGSC 9003) TaxID=240176 RepID=A8NH44_COPC7|nr:Set1 complex component ash2 [Coprinopsis cinerea okayama7\|eukprot:XP_001833677.2 Set1 complex component ash2 [Coprinopsis cinerea okayama7\